MKQTVKASLLLCVFALCALGVIYSPKERPQDHEEPTQVVPVNNRPPHRGIWLRV